MRFTTKGPKRSGTNYIMVGASKLSFMTDIERAKIFNAYAQIHIHSTRSQIKPMNSLFRNLNEREVMTYTEYLSKYKVREDEDI